MRGDHIPIFKAATTNAFPNKEYVACILLRNTNQQSIKFFSHGDCQPKPLKCKAKTANAYGHPLAGLVVNPFLVPEAFRRGQLWKAKLLWSDFELRVLGFDKAWSVEKHGTRAGCLKLDERYLHGDYDLFDVISMRLTDLGPGNRLHKLKSKAGVSSINSATVKMRDGRKIISATAWMMF